MKRKKTALCFLILGILTGCTGSVDVPGEGFQISGKTDSPYEKTFKDLDLGYAFDYRLTVPEGSTGWVTMWAEVYEKGEPREQGEMAFSWEKSEKTVDLAYGLLNIDEKPYFLYYGSGSGMKGRSDQVIGYRFDQGSAAWEDLSEETPLKAEYGSDLLLAVYRGSLSGPMEAVDYGDPVQLDALVRDSDFVVLFRARLDQEPPER